MISEEMEQLVKLFDFALTSDNPAVKKALKNLLLLVSIIEPEESNNTPGPLRQLQDEIMKLRGEILKLHTDVALIKERNRLTTSPTTYPNTTYPTTYPNTTTYPSYPSYPWIVTSSASLADSPTTSMVSYNGSNISVSDVDITSVGSLIQEYNRNSKDIKLT